MIEAVSCSLMKKLDQNTITHMGIPSLVLMREGGFKNCRRDRSGNLQPQIIGKNFVRLWKRK